MIKINLFKNANLLAFISCFAISIYCYWGWLYDGTLNIDGEFTNNFYQTITLGRWFHTFLRHYFLPEPFSLYITPLIALSFIIISAFIICRSLKLESYELLIGMLVFITFPQISYQLEFLNQADTVGIAFLLAAISAIIFHSQKNRIVIFSGIVLSILSMAIYQTFVTYIIAFVIGLQINSIIRNEKNIRESFYSSCLSLSLIALSTLIYLLLTKAIKHYFSLESNEYISNYIQNASDIKWLVKSAIDNIYNFYNNPPTGLNLYKWLLIPLLILMFTLTYKLKTRSIYLISSIIFIYILPVIFIVVVGSGAPPRLFVLMPIVAVILFSCLSNFRSIKYLNCMFFLFIIFNGVSTSKNLFLNDTLARQKDISLAKEISYTSQTKGISLNGKYIYIYGSNDSGNMLSMSADTFGKSFFWWDGGNYFRMVAFMNYYGICNCKPANKEQIEKIYPIVKSLPSWPNPDSIAEINGLVIIKLSEKK
ncbi:glucosyl transferase, partial [Shigella flexneri]|nr:glucosyl transferase [Shigella flexneri]